LIRAIVPAGEAIVRYETPSGDSSEERRVTLDPAIVTEITFKKPQ